VQGWIHLDPLDIATGQGGWEEDGAGMDSRGFWKTIPGHKRQGSTRRRCKDEFIEVGENCTSPHQAERDNAGIGVSGSWETAKLQ
jgi:hypothetical protein